MRDRRPRGGFVVVALALAALSCDKPKPPQVTPQEARVVAVGPTGLRLMIRFDAYNPNAYALPTVSATGTVVVDGKFNLGNLAVNQLPELAPEAHTQINVPFDMPWTSAALLGLTAAAGRPEIPYTVAGNVRLGGKIALDVPYSVAGKLTQAQLKQVATRSLPTLPSIPGLNLPPL